MQQASLLAAYSARAIVVRDPQDVIDVQLQTALLDQGAVVERDGQLVVLSAPGDVVPSPLQYGDDWITCPRWNEFHRTIMASPQFHGASA